MFCVSDVPAPIRNVAKRHGWSGDPADNNGLAKALERAREQVPSKNAGSCSIAELIDDIYFAENPMLVSATINSIPKYRNITDETEADTPYLGTVIAASLLEEMEGPDPYDRWQVTLLLESGTEIITMFADNPLIEEQDFTEFRPEYHMGKKVIVNLGSEFSILSGERDIVSILHC